MSYRPNVYSRRDPDQRHEVWSPSYRKNTSYNRFQGHNPSKFFTKTLICKRKPHIRLFCPHCHTRCLTFVDYKKHLLADKHLRAMDRRIVVIEREIENKRKEQLAAQAIADKAAKMQHTSSTVLKYCAVCDVHFSQEESKHIASKLHIALQKLLEPICNICSYQAKDAVDYENHICSLDHLKREESWTGETKELDNQPFEEVPKSYESKGEEASTSSKDNASEPSTSCKAVTIQLYTEANIEPSKYSINPTGYQEDDLKDALYCRRCNVYFDCEEGKEAAKVKHCQSQQHLELWIKTVEGISKDGSKE